LVHPRDWPWQGNAAQGLELYLCVELRGLDRTVAQDLRDLPEGRSPLEHPPSQAVAENVGADTAFGL
jgi:hypothetical protein